MLAVIIPVILLIGISLWVILLFYLKKRKSNFCGYQQCGSYDNGHSSDIEFHLCRHPKISSENFDQIRGTNTKCPVSSEYVGVDPAIHLQTIHIIWGWNRSPYGKN